MNKKTEFQILAKFPLRHPLSTKACYDPLYKSLWQEDSLGQGTATGALHMFWKGEWW